MLRARSRPRSGVTTSPGCRSFHDGAQRPAPSSGHISAARGIAAALARERVHDRLVVPAAAPGVSILPCVLGVTVVRRQRVPCGTPDRPLYGRASHGEPRNDAIWSRFQVSRRGGGRGRKGIVFGWARAGAQAASVIVPSRCASYVVPSGSQSAGPKRRGSRVRDGVRSAPSWHLQASHAPLAKFLPTVARSSKPVQIRTSPSVGYGAGPSHLCGRLRGMGALPPLQKNGALR